MVHSLDAAKTEKNNFLRDAKKTKESTFLVMLQSGKMKDAANVVNASQKNDLTIISIVNSVGSLIACMTKLGVYCNADRENAITAVLITSV
jgi:glucosamine--fructose-6-phosphate aminotransferase (isomerizing)